MSYPAQTSIHQLFSIQVASDKRMPLYHPLKEKLYIHVHKYIAPGLGVSDNTHRTPVVDRSRHKDVHHRNPRCCEDDRAYDGEDLLLEAAELADIFQEIV